MLGAAGEVSVGLNQGRIPPDYHWRAPGPGWSHGRNYGLEPGEEPWMINLNGGTSMPLCEAHDTAAAARAVRVSGRRLS
jgi:hypothetical protein